MTAVEAVAAESLSRGDRLWSERRGACLGTVVLIEDIDDGARIGIHWRHTVNETQSTVSSQTVSRDAMIPVVVAER